MTTPLITDVSETARWVAVYRANESKRPDALFSDPFADQLAGERGFQIAQTMSDSIYTGWTVVIRTCIIDDYLRELVAQGIDTVINLGAGLDTRPYRMDLPSELRWVEVDYPHLIQYKEEILAREKPKCRLERIGVDLADREVRQKLFAELAAGRKSCAVLTEGVIPYLSNEEAASLAKDLKAHPVFQYWIAEYLSPPVMKYLHSKRRAKKMKNAPFRFNPSDWYGFFASAGWKARETRYLPEESMKRGRSIPGPWWMRILRVFMRAEDKKKYAKFAGFVLFEQNGRSSY